jgi:4-amino-4-deoxy-L-arabinose transferase-like glycosyltransferase
VNCAKADRPEPSPEGRTMRCVLPALIAAAFVFWSFQLGVKSFWDDEILSIRHAESLIDLSSLFSMQCGNAHPPVYFLALRPWLLLGQEEGWTRLLSVILAVPSLALVYLLGKRLTNPLAGLIGSALFAVMPILLIYFREVRMYSLLTTFSCASLLLLLKALDENTKTRWCLFSAMTFLTLITHYHGFLILLAQGIFFLLYLVKTPNRLPLLKRFTLSSAAALLLFVPFLPALLQAMGTAPTMWRSGAGSFLISRGYLAFSLVLGQTIMPWDPVAVVGGLAFAALFSMSLWQIRTRAVLVAILISYALVVFLAGPLVSHDMPRYYLFFAPLICIVLGYGISALQPRYLALALTVLLLFSWGKADANYFSGRDFHVMAHVDPWREISDTLQGSVSARDRILVRTSYALDSYYLPNRGLKELVIEDPSRLDDPGTVLPDHLWFVVNHPASTQLAEEIRRDIEARHGYSVKGSQRFLRDPNFEIKKKYFHKDFAEYRIEIFQLCR